MIIQKNKLPKVIFTILGDSRFTHRETPEYEVITFDHKRIYCKRIDTTYTLDTILNGMEEIDKLLEIIYRHHKEKDHNWYAYITTGQSRFIIRDKSMWDYVPQKMIKIRNAIMVSAYSFTQSLTEDDQDVL